MLQKWEHIRYFIDFSCEIFIASSVNDLILYLISTLPIFPIGPSLMAFEKRGIQFSISLELIDLFTLNLLTQLCYRMFTLRIKTIISQFCLNNQQWASSFFSRSSVNIFCLRCYYYCYYCAITAPFPLYSNEF